MYLSTVFMSKCTISGYQRHNPKPFSLKTNLAWSPGLDLIKGRRLRVSGLVARVRVGYWVMVTVKVCIQISEDPVAVPIQCQPLECISTCVLSDYLWSSVE